MYNVQTAEKMANKTDYLNQLLEFLSKWGAWISYVVIGLIGSVGWDIINRKRISLAYIIGTTFIAGFVGYLSCRWCIIHCPEQGPYIVPVITLGSRDIMVLLRAIDWKALLQVLLKIKINK